jgi:FMN phosphatase YigB (HAD superfamily)
MIISTQLGGNGKIGNGSTTKPMASLPAVIAFLLRFPSLISAGMENVKVLIESILTDADGTLYSFWGYFCPAMEKAMTNLSKVFSERAGREVTKDEISWELGLQMHRFGTHEYPFVWEVSKFWQDPQWRTLWKDYAEFRAMVVEPYWQTLDEQFAKDFMVYDEVYETLVTLKELGIPVVILSDGPAYMVKRKIKEVLTPVGRGIDHLLAGVYALETHEPGTEFNLTDEELAFGRERMKSCLELELECPFTANPKEFEKPDPRGAQRVMDDFGFDPATTMFVGDSLKKDRGVAQKLGLLYIWARYGVQMFSSDRRRIDYHFAAGEPKQQKPILPTLVDGQELPPMVGTGSASRGASTWASVLDYLLSTGPVPMLRPQLEATAHTAPVDGSGH